MTEHQSIIPPQELVQQWVDEIYSQTECDDARDEHIATQAARWGADTELEACCEYMQHEDFHGFAKELRAARRPKPPSDKELALEALQSMRIDPELIKTINGNTDLKAKYDTIRRALKALPND
jgi:hypothetical protein